MSSVLTLMPSSVAISRLGWPAAIMAPTCRSRGVSRTCRSRAMATVTPRTFSAVGNGMAAGSAEVVGCLPVILLIASLAIGWDGKKGAWGDEAAAIIEGRDCKLSGGKPAAQPQGTGNPSARPGAPGGET